ncbi:putative expressed protein [Lyophyllum shimeji]|uniref:Expressed protein n=1 Tax=Lyophyllum shimeji TaxID=47721 RepID=A0A9P3Q0L9_LYOSH|nr:putative expressed protein [Lyophyllum shimeji]
MTFVLPRLRRPRLIHAILGGTLFFLYFLWFHWCTRTRPSLQPYLPSEITSTPPAGPARILLVSALLPPGQPKYPLDYYHYWLTHFLGPTGVRCDVYFYTTPSLEPFLSSLNHPLKLTIDTAYATPFDLPLLAPHKESCEGGGAWRRGCGVLPLFEVPSRKEYPWTPEQGSVDVDSSEGTFFSDAHDYYLSTAPPLAFPLPPTRVTVFLGLSLTVPSVTAIPLNRQRPKPYQYPLLPLPRPFFRRYRTPPHAAPPASFLAR